MAKGKSHRIRVSERMTALETGELSFESLTDEEVARGRLAAADGTFKGRPPAYQSRKFAEGLRREQIRRWELRVAQELEPSLQVLSDIAQNKARKGVPADARVKAAEYLIERAVGKVPDKVQATVEIKPWEEDIESLLFDPDKKEAG